MPFISTASPPPLGKTEDGKALTTRPALSTAFCSSALGDGRLGTKVGDRASDASPMEMADECDDEGSAYDEGISSL